MAARRVSLPAADNLFRATEQPGQQSGQQSGQPGQHARQRHAGAGSRARRPNQPSGRVRHDEKMTVYVTAEELVEIEQARLRLRSEHGLAVDRGRLVREAVAMALSALEEAGADSELVRRLSR